MASTIMRYPYASTLQKTLFPKKQGFDYLLWQDNTFNLPLELSQITSEVLELAGPSVDGYYFLEGIDLPQPITISNLYESPAAVDTITNKEKALITELIDATAIPRSDNSLGMILAHYISKAIDPPPTDHASKDNDSWRIAENEMIAVSLGIKTLNEAPTAQRLHMWREAYRTLKPGGLLIVDLALYELPIVKQLGFIPRALVASNEFIDEIVLQKAS